MCIRLGMNRSATNYSINAALLKLWRAEECIMQPRRMILGKQQCTNVQSGILAYVPKVVFVN